MASLLEDQEMRRANIPGGGNIEEREKMIEDSEKRLKEGQLELKIESERLRVLI